MATKQEIYKAGFNRGFNIASWVDMPEIGSSIDKYIDWQGLGSTVTEENLADYMETLAFESESMNREYSPFEFTAHDLNEMSETKPYDVWEVFESGIAAGIRKNISKRIRACA
jgi:hypothetical protein